jgi:serine/threonine protein phosphatase PrpC
MSLSVIVTTALNEIVQTIFIVWLVHRSAELEKITEKLSKRIDNAGGPDN